MPHRLFFIKLSDTLPYLKKFIEVESQRDSVCESTKEKAVAAQELLKWFENLPYFKGTIDSEKIPENQKGVSDSDIKEEITMIDTGVTTLTVSDIEDIKTRAEALKEAFDVSKKDALRAVVQLKSEEINRNLTPLIELLKSN